MHDKKRLIIIQDIDLETLKNFDRTNADILCIDVECMAKLQTSGLKFLSFYDFYTRADYLKNLKEKLDVLKEIFRELDARYDPIINYPRVFMGNYYLFLVYFSDFFFISEVIARLKNEYQDFSIYTSHKKEELDNYKVSIGIDFFEPFSIIKNRDFLILGLLQEGLLPEMIYSRSMDTLINPGKISYYLSVLMSSNKGLAANYFSTYLKNRYYIILNRNKKIIFSIDINYEPSYLLPFMGEYHFINPIKIIKEAKLDKKDNIPDFIETENDSIRNLTTLKNETFLNILKVYQRDVIPFISSFIDQMNLNILEFKPLCMFFSIGQVDILENITAYLSNENKIPVFNFQHGDGIEFSPDILEFNRYIEFNENIKKTLVLRSRKQYELLNSIKPENTELFMGGSCKIFDYIRYLPGKKNGKNKKVLVIIGHYPANAYKTLTGEENDFEIFNKHNQMFKIFKKYEIEAHLKIFPNNKYINYFKEMLRYHDLTSGKIIIQPNVEFLLGDYDMVLMEYIGSALTPLLMGLDVPVVYWSHKQFINQNVLEDFCRLFYLISNDSEFEDVIRKLKDNKLASKYDSELVEQYCFPSLTTPPEKIISDHIKSQISTNNVNR
ncbi:MAG: hypothetical protein O8C61_04440 [Candidatus Methanoperedens sp.]|nr:hypothetical protein [Candidatus Methanoperedens sp.]